MSGLGEPGGPLVGGVDEALKGLGEIFVFVMDEIELPFQGGIPDRDRLELLCRTSSFATCSGDEGEAHPLLHRPLDGLVVRELQGDGDREAVTGQEFVDDLPGGGALFVDDEGLPVDLLRFDLGLPGKGMTLGNDKDEAILQDLPDHMPGILAEGGDEPHVVLEPQRVFNNLLRLGRIMAETKIRGASF